MSNRKAEYIVSDSTANSTKEQLLADIAALRLTIDELTAAQDAAMHKARMDTEHAMQRANLERDRAAQFLKEEVSQYEVESGQLTHRFIAVEDIIHIQAGNKHYDASRALLMREKDWLMEYLLVANPGETSFFIDRDGEHFGHILYWLRTGYLHMDPGRQGPIRQLRAETLFYGLKSLTVAIDSLLAASVATQHRYAVLTFSPQFQPVSFLGVPPEGIDLFEYDGDCFKSFKDIRKVLSEMAVACWHLETTIAPSAFNGRLVFHKREDHGTLPLVADPVLSMTK